MNRHENQTMKIFGKRLTAGLLGAALVMSMPFASALTQKNITVGRGVTIYVDDRKINPGDANGAQCADRMGWNDVQCVSRRT